MNRKPGRPKGRSNPLQTVESARAYLLNRRPSNVVARMLLMAMFARLTQALRHFGAGVTWALETRKLLRKIDDPPAVLANLPRTSESGEAEDAAVHAALELARTVAAAKRAAHQAAPFLDLWTHPALQNLLHAPDVLEAMLWIVQGGLIASSQPQATPSELMALSVAARLEAPTDDVEARLNTWSTRARRSKAADRLEGVPELKASLDNPAWRKALVVLRDLTFEQAVDFIETLDAIATEGSAGRFG